MEVHVRFRYFSNKSTRYTEVWSYSFLAYLTTSFIELFILALSLLGFSDGLLKRRVAPRPYLPYGEQHCLALEKAADACVLNFLINTALSYITQH